MKDILSKFKPKLTKEGVLYSPPGQKGIKCAVVLEDLDRGSLFEEDWNYNKGKVLGFGSYHKLTVEPYYYATISKKMGKPGKYFILETDNLLEIIHPIDCADTINSALDKAHDYLFNKILEEVLHPDDVYVNLLDTTKIGREKFEKREKNKANLSAKKSFGITVDKSKATHTCNMRITPFSKGSRLNY
jgi:hypothetical protein